VKNCISSLTDIGELSGLPHWFFVENGPAFMV
jgi:hypothetical protein